jgi:hypothetical protein
MLDPGPYVYIEIRIRKTLNAGASICREQGEADQLRHSQPHLQGGRSGRHTRARAGTAAALPTAAGGEQSRFRMFYDAARLSGEGGLEGGEGAEALRRWDKSRGN